MTKKEIPEQLAVITKRKTYHLTEGQEGQPVEEAFPDAKIPESLKGAKLYQTAEGPVIAKPPRK